jgi:DNA-directed RNA polymerase specialized sigma24 family protein
VFDRASHQQVAQEFGISVYASQKRLERIRDKLYTVFPERKRRKKK